MALISLKCPNCAGDIELDDTREFGFCMYCGSKVMITRDVNNISIEMSVKDQRECLKPLAVAYCKKGEFDKATDIARKLVSANAADADIWAIDGLCRLMSEDIDGGLESLEKVAILSGSGSLEDAIDAVEDGYLVDPVSKGDRKAMKALAEAYSRIGTPVSDRKIVERYFSYLDCSSLESDSKIIKSVRVAEIPSSVTSIGNGAFDGCGSLASVSIPSTVTSIGGNAFHDCSSLASVDIPDSVTSIGWRAFSHCTSLASVSIPSSVTSIGDRAFENCKSLTSVSIPSSVTSIGNGTFDGCGSLASVSIPSSVTSIGVRTFCGCKSLASVSIPSSVTSIGIGAFDGCESLATVSIPSSVTSIGDRAFEDCKSLASASIPSSVTSIGNGVFKKCTSLASVSIPPSVTSIGMETFWDCAFDSICVPPSVTSIGRNAFPKHCKILWEKSLSESNDSQEERKGLKKLLGLKR